MAASPIAGLQPVLDRRLADLWREVGMAASPIAGLQQLRHGEIHYHANS